MTQADVWMEGWLSGDLPASEMEAFQTWLRNEPRNRRLFLAAVALDQDLRAAYRLPQINRLRRWRSIAAIVGMAAVVLIAASVMLAWFLLPRGTPASGPVVCGWTLSKELELVSNQRPAPGLDVPTITAPRGGTMERAGSLVQLQPGAKVILRDPEPGGTTRTIQLVAGRLSASIQNQAPHGSAAPPQVDRLTQLNVETVCGTIVLEQGCKAEMTFSSFNAPSGESGERVEIFVLAGLVMPPDLGPRPIAPKPLTTGARIQLTRIGEGPVRMKRLSSSQ